MGTREEEENSPVKRKDIESPTLDVRCVLLPYGRPSGRVPTLIWPSLRVHAPEYDMAALSLSTTTVFPESGVFSPAVTTAKSTEVVAKPLTRIVCFPSARSGDLYHCVYNRGVLP